MPSDCCKF